MPPSKNKLINFILEPPRALKASYLVIAGAAALIGFYATFSNFYKEVKGKQLIKITGYVSESKDTIIPVDAVVKISRPFQKETDTDLNGKFSFTLEGASNDSFLFVIQNKASKLETKREYFIDADNEKNSFLIVFNPTLKEGQEYTKATGNVPPPITNQEKIRPVSSGDKGIATPTEIVNNGETADFAVIAIVNGKQNGPIASKFIAWLQKKGSGSQSVLQNLFIEQKYFDQVFDGNSSVIKKTKAATQVKYVCLVRVTHDLSKSKIDESLTLAVCNYEVMIIEAGTGKIMDNFDQTEKASDISEDAARRRAEKNFFDFLDKKSITF